MKILFLDVDGVLNSMRSAVAFHSYPRPGASDTMSCMDAVAVALIRNICIKTGAKIVLSSTWRLSDNWPQYAGQWDLPIIDRTPYLPGHKRGAEIQAWLDDPKMHDLIEAYAIVDDDSDMLEGQRPFFVQTDEKNGLTLDNYDALLRRLS